MNDERLEILRALRKEIEKDLREQRDDPELHVHIRGEDPRLTCDECTNLSDEELAERLKTTLLVDVAI